MSVINWMNGNEGFVMSVLTLVYVSATIVIVCKMMTANKLTMASIKNEQERENERRRPRVIFDFVVDRRCVFAEVRNEGLTSAVNVKFEVPDDLVELGKRGEVEFPFTKPISYLSPGSRQKTLLSAGWEFFGKHDKPEFTIKISYQDNQDNNYVETIHHDITYMKDIVGLGEIYLDKEVEEIKKILKQLGQTVAKISNTHETLTNSPPALRVGLTSTRYSQKALAVARIFVEESKHGMRLDPSPFVSDLVEKTNLILDDVLEAIDELEEGGFIKLNREISLSRDDPSQQVIVENLLFVEFDRFWMDWDAEEDARRIAKDMVSNKDFPSGLENALKMDRLEQMRQITSRYNWESRRLNPALCWLEKRKLITLHSEIRTAPYVCFAVDGNFPALRRFMKISRDEQVTET